MEKLLENLSFNLADSFLDLRNVGIHIYDPFSVEIGEEGKVSRRKTNKPRAISLRSKSTRNLKVRKRTRNLS